LHALRRAWRKRERGRKLIPVQCAQSWRAADRLSASRQRRGLGGPGHCTPPPSPGVALVHLYAGAVPPHVRIAGLDLGAGSLRANIMQWCRRGAADGHGVKNAPIQASGPRGPACLAFEDCKLWRFADGPSQAVGVASLQGGDGKDKTYRWRLGPNSRQQCQHLHSYSSTPTHLLQPHAARGIVAVAEHGGGSGSGGNSIGARCGVAQRDPTAHAAEGRPKVHAAPLPRLLTFCTAPGCTARRQRAASRCTRRSGSSTAEGRQSCTNACMEECWHAVRKSRCSRQEAQWTL
jgi:hypothetical protein